MLRIMLKSNEPSGPESIQSCVDPFRQQFLPWPTKGWSCEIMGPKLFASPSSLLVDPGDICPPHKAGHASRRGWRQDGLALSALKNVVKRIDARTRSRSTVVEVGGEHRFSSINHKVRCMSG
jgi:hypothetical protein